MDTDIFPLLLAIFGSLFLSAIFSNAWHAFAKFGKHKLRNALEDKSLHNTSLAKLLHDEKKLGNALLISQYFFMIAAISISAINLYHFFRISLTFNVTFCLIIITFLLTALSLIFTEFIPNLIANRYKNQLAMWYARPAYLLTLGFKPFLTAIDLLVSRLTPAIGLRLKEEDSVTHEEVKAIVKLAEEEGILEEQEKDMIHSIFEFSETIVREIMTPRTDAVSVDVNSTLQEAIEVIQEKGHSRIPAYEDNIDNIVGIVYAKDLLGLSASNYQSNLKKFIREAIFIPETTSIEDILHQMKKAKCHIAIVVDEYGGMSGLVTLEDIIEEIIGEIQDEYDKDKTPEFTEINPNHYMVDAQMNIDDFSQKINFTFPSDEDYDTIGGFALSIFGKFPSRGEQISFQNLKITVKEISNRRILKLDIKKTHS